MNNSKIAFDNVEEGFIDRRETLLIQQGTLTQIVEAIKGVELSTDWQKLKRLVLDDVVENLESKLFAEVSRKEINTSEIYRLQGQLEWAKKYADLHKLAESFKQQVDNLKKLNNEQTNPRDGAL